MSLKKSNIIVSTIIVVASVGALFGLSYQAPTTAILTETGYPMVTGATTVPFYSTSYANYLSSVRVACAYWINHQASCTAWNGNPDLANAQALMMCLTTTITFTCVVVERNENVTYSSAVNTPTYYYTADITQASTTILFSTFSTNAPPNYVSTFGINQTDFTYLSFFVIIAAIALAIIIAYPKKFSSQSTPPKNLQWVQLICNN